jgi:hypothetical protein
MLSLDPSGDPHGALLHLDFLAPKVGLGGWMLELWDAHAARVPENGEKGRWRGRINVTVLPGWAFARALALRAKEDAEKDKVGHLWFMRMGRKGLIEDVGT